MVNKRKGGTREHRSVTPILDFCYGIILLIIAFVVAWHQ